MINLIFSLFVKKPNIEIIPLGITKDELNQMFDVSKMEIIESEWKDTESYVQQMGENKMIFTMQNNVVKEIIYNFELYRKWGWNRLKKLNYFLNEYSKQSKLIFFIDNKFGFLYKSDDENIRASYSYVADIFSINYSELVRK